MSQKANAPILSSWLFSANCISDKGHRRNALLPISVTFRGTIILLSYVFAKQLSPILRRRLFSPKTICRSSRQSVNAVPMSSTVLGIYICRIPVLQKQSSPILCKPSLSCTFLKRSQQENAAFYIFCSDTGASNCSRPLLLNAPSPISQRWLPSPNINSCNER